MFGSIPHSTLVGLSAICCARVRSERNAGVVGSGTPALFGPVATGDKVTFTRSGKFPNDIYFELFTDAAMTSPLGR